MDSSRYTIIKAAGHVDITDMTDQLRFKLSINTVSKQNMVAFGKSS